MRYLILLTLLCGIFVAKPTCSQEKGISENMNTKKEIVLVHGLYVSYHCWDEWKSYLESKGYTVYVPSYPLLDGAPSVIRSHHPSKEIAKLNLAQVVDHYRIFLKGFKHKPILIGHSMGGLISQVLLGEGLASCAVAIDSAPPNGVVSPFTALFAHGFQFVSNQWDFINPFASDAVPILMSPEHFKSQFANGIPEKVQLEEYEKFAVPTSRLLGKGALEAAGRVNFSEKRNPLLLISGSEDRIIPVSVVKANKTSYASSAGITDYKEFTNRGHFLICQPGWEEICDYSLKWIDQYTKAAAK